VEAYCQETIRARCSLTGVTKNTKQKAGKAKKPQKPCGKQHKIYIQTKNKQIISLNSPKTKNEEIISMYDDRTRYSFKNQLNCHGSAEMSSSTVTSSLSAKVISISPSSFLGTRVASGPD